MTSFVRTLLVVLLALPATALPPGVTLEWCLCWTAECCCDDHEEAPLDAAPCREHLGDASCCGGAPAVPSDEPEEDDVAQRTSCPSCHSLEAGDVELGLESTTASLDAAPLAVFVRLAESRVVTLSRAFRFVAGRAPPGAVRPAGLLPGTLPQLR